MLQVEEFLDTIFFMTQVLVTRLFLSLLNSFNTFHVVVHQWLGLFGLFAFFSQGVQLVNLFFFVFFVFIFIFVFDIFGFFLLNISKLVYWKRKKKKRKCGQYCEVCGNKQAWFCSIVILLRFPNPESDMCVIVTCSLKRTGLASNCQRNRFTERYAIHGNTRKVGGKNIILV